MNHLFAFLYASFVDRGLRTFERNLFIEEIKGIEGVTYRYKILSTFENGRLGKKNI